MSSSHLKYEIILIVMGKAGYLTQNKKFSINEIPPANTGGIFLRATPAVSKAITDWDRPDEHLDS